MAKHNIRKDNICENCGHTVEVRFCTHCGQENVETRQTFGHLVGHFMEDLTHYESNIWKTIKYLLFRPAYLTKCYLAGKRMTYVPPVKLYIFISFIAFFLPGILPNFNAATDVRTEYISIGNSLTKKGNELTEKGNALKEKNSKSADTMNQNISVLSSSDFKTEKEYDSVQNALPQDKKATALRSWMSKRTIYFQNLSPEEKKEKFQEQMKHNFPKVLFIYLPLFAFFVWLFHSKKKWYYFDHAIFTLHYFSFLLLMRTLFKLIYQLIPWHLMMDASLISNGLSIVGIIWSIHYFYRAHRKLYEEKFGVSWFKSSAILFVNTTIFLILLVGFVMFTVFTIH